MKKSICIFVLMFLLSASQIKAADSSFSRNLKLGDRGEDVRKLQIILNSDPETQIATSGDGSPGRETTYFGQKTKVAVIKFQNKYRSEILVPTNLTMGTGFVGALTREKLNDLGGALKGVAAPFFLLEKFARHPSRSSTPVLVTPAKPSTSSVTFSQATDYPEMSELRLYQIVPYQAKPGEKVTVTGDNFGTGALLHIGENNTATLSSTGKANTYETTIPITISENKYEVWVTNTKGSSRRSDLPLYLTISRSSKSAPVIASVSPKNVTELDEIITLKGVNFIGTLSLASAFGVISDIKSPDGSSISFKPSQFSHKDALEKVMKGRPAGALISVPFYLVSDAGLASGTFVVQ